MPRLILVLLSALQLPAAALADDWPQFRGPGSANVAPAAEWPLDWTQRAWQVDLPGRGPSSPIVVDGRVIVTCSSGANQDRLQILAFDAESGQPLWRREFWATGRTICNPATAIAAPTPASDGRAIYAFFSSNDLICLDLDGNLKWLRGLALDYPEAGNDTGMSSSPLVIRETVIVQVENQGDSFAAGIDADTGETRWRIARDRKANWSSPALHQNPPSDQFFVLLQSPTGLSAHEPRTGQEVWRLKADCDTITSTVSVDGVAYLPSIGVTALRAEGAAKPRVLWQENRLAPSAASPVVQADRIYTINRAGVLNCGEAATGKPLWQLRLTGRFWATPLVAGDHLFAVNSEGLAQIVRLGEKGEIVAKAEFSETIQATPAAAHAAFFVRSDKHLWKIARP